MLIVNQIERSIQDWTQQFSDDIHRFEGLLEKQIHFNGKKINFITQFHALIIVDNPLTIRLIEFIEIYDRLIAVIKLLHLAGCFATERGWVK